MQILRCEALYKSFGGFHALAGVSLQFPPSGIVAIIGPNGAGKTTLLHVLTGFLKPDAGHCFLGQREITHQPPHKIAGLGVVRTFQDLRLVFQISALENVLLARPRQRGELLRYALVRYGIAAEAATNREDALQFLRFVGLEDQATQLGEALSYGQQKLLTIACILATEARILLLDEPVAGVHPAMVSQILGLLQHLREAGKLVVFVEHNIEAVRQIADWIIVMDEGKVIVQGRPSQVLERPEVLEAYLG